jgi:HSP20 family protein
MNLTPWNPWQEIERVQEEMASLLGSVLEKLRRILPGRPIAFVPVIDIVELAQEYRLYISLPGIVEEDVDIGIEGDILTIRGEREPPYDPAQATLHQRQWRYGYFERRVKLPEPLDQDAIRATYETGVLTIRIRKPGDLGKPATNGEPGEGGAP